MTKAKLGTGARFAALKNKLGAKGASNKKKTNFNKMAGSR